MTVLNDKSPELSDDFMLSKRLSLKMLLYELKNSTEFTKGGLVMVRELDINLLLKY